MSEFLASLRARYAAPTLPAFTFIDLFAGIGGLRLAFQAVGGRCLFSSEWDEKAADTYERNHGHRPVGDITQVSVEGIPPHDVLLGGFPCQPFSTAGIALKNHLGRPHGFDDKVQGTLFFDVARIIEYHRPKAFLLENVRGLVSHDRGRTLQTILKVLGTDLGYHVQWRILSAENFVPQRRPRIVIVGFREKVAFSLNSMGLPRRWPRLSSILHPEDGTEASEAHYTQGPSAEVSDQYYLSSSMWEFMRQHKRKNRVLGRGFGYNLYGPQDVAGTLTASYRKDGKDILIKGRRGPRTLTPREAARLMGYPDTFLLHPSDAQAYRQLGNSVVPPLFQHIALHMKPYICTK